MSRIFFREELEGVATWWRIHRRDGVTLGFTSHDRDLWFDGVLHRGAPGMLPAAIRKSAELDPDSAEVQGALTHDSISAADLAAGRYDGARIEMGAVDWENLERATLYHGSIGVVAEEGTGFTAELRSAKADLAIDPIPRTSPTCRARFGGPGCTLSLVRFTHEAQALAIDFAENRVQFDIADHALFASGELRWLDGPQAGLRIGVAAADTGGIVPDTPLDPALETGLRAQLREGCDHRLATCHARFANAANFQGEPFLPGNDLLARYPSPS
jgi:uncharacterized phage protein (TIGR02218 family)